MDNQLLEVIDSGQMKILSEFPFEGEMQERIISYRIGVLNENFIIAGLSSRSQNPQFRTIPQNGTEREKLGAEYEIKRGFWFGKVFLK